MVEKVWADDIRNKEEQRRFTEAYKENWTK